MIGRTVSSFKITREIGFGGMGKVFAGIDLILEREVAIKVLRSELTYQASIVSRFHAEAVTLAKLNHPKIATVYAFLQDGEDYFLIMEFIRGWTLREIIAAHNPMPPATAIALFHQALEGIGFAHKQGIIHRDIKPSNFILTETGLLKVMDFGIARILGSGRLTRTGHLLGTLEYMSPEQIRGETTDSRSDIYSLGILLYELLTGRAPFEADSDFKLMKAQVEATPPSPRDFRPDLPVELERAILYALAKDPGQRFQSVEDFAATITSHSGDIDTQTASLQALLNSLKEPQARPSTESQLILLTSTDNESLGKWSSALQKTQVITAMKSQATRFTPTLKETLRAINIVKDTRLAEDLAQPTPSSPLRPSRHNRYLSLTLLIMLLVVLISLPFIPIPSFAPAGTPERINPSPIPAEAANKPNQSEPLPPVNDAPSIVIPAATLPQTPAAISPDTAVPVPETQLPASAGPTVENAASTRVPSPELPSASANESPLAPETLTSSVPATTTQLAPSSKGTTPLKMATQSKTAPKSTKKTVVANKPKAESEPNFPKSLIEKGGNWFKGLLHSRGSDNSGWNHR
jgi:serine/threonine-protein kinase